MNIYTIQHDRIKEENPYSVWLRDELIEDDRLERPCIGLFENCRNGFNSVISLKSRQMLYGEMFRLIMNSFLAYLKYSRINNVKEKNIGCKTMAFWLKTESTTSEVSKAKKNKCGSKTAKN